MVGAAIATLLRGKYDTRLTTIITFFDRHHAAGYLIWVNFDWRGYS